MSATLDQCITEHERMMVLQERERCAKIADEFTDIGYYGEAARQIAAKIRKGE
jgi:hypothetical protein